MHSVKKKGFQCMSTRNKVENYCTLFNSYYLSRGLALYRSLLKHAKEFHLFIFAFDDVTYEILKKINLEHATIISLKEFETPALLAVKSERTVGEYCWTCTSSVILHCLEKYGLCDVCYLDADLYFFDSPAVLLQEAKEASILITEHRYSKEYDYSALSGKYCVQFMYFKNDANGLEALKWWQKACIAWCFNRVEDGKFGDQKYLDDWPSRFTNVKVLEHVGGGVAPWNVQQYDLKMEADFVEMRKKATSQNCRVIFYHFHGLKFIDNRVDFGRYKLSQKVINILYKPYVKQLFLEEEKLKKDIELSTLTKSINLHGKTTEPFSLIQFLRNLKRKWEGLYNSYLVTDLRH